MLFLVTTVCMNVVSFPSMEAKPNRGKNNKKQKQKRFLKIESNRIPFNQIVGKLHSLSILSAIVGNNQKGNNKYGRTYLRLLVSVLQLFIFRFFLFLLLLSFILHALYFRCLENFTKLK